MLEPNYWAACFWEISMRWIFFGSFSLFLYRKNPINCYDLQLNSNYQIFIKSCSIIQVDDLMSNSITTQRLLWNNEDYFRSWKQFLFFSISKQPIKNNIDVGSLFLASFLHWYIWILITIIATWATLLMVVNCFQQDITDALIFTNV